ATLGDAGGQLGEQLGITVVGTSTGPTATSAAPGAQFAHRGGAALAHRLAVRAGRCPGFLQGATGQIDTAKRFLSGLIAHRFPLPPRSAPPPRGSVSATTRSRFLPSSTPVSRRVRRVSGTVSATPHRLDLGIPQLSKSCPQAL